MQYIVVSIIIHNSNNKYFREYTHTYRVIEGYTLVLQHGDRHILAPGRGVTRPTQEDLILGR